MKTKERVLITLILIYIVLLGSGCESGGAQNYTYTANQIPGIIKVEIQEGWSRNTYEIFEYEYRGHTYMGCKVRDGISSWHAGHCECNSNAMMKLK